MNYNLDIFFSTIIIIAIVIGIIMGVVYLGNEARKEMRKDQQTQIQKIKECVDKSNNLEWCLNNFYK